MFPLREIVYDTIKWAIMFVISKWISGGTLTDRAWQLSSLFTIIGFLTYNISTRHFFAPMKGSRRSNRSSTAKLVVDDWMKFGTMFITARALSGASLLNLNWMYGVLATMVGYTIYDVLTVKFAKGNQLTYKVGLQNTIDDWMKFGTMFIVARILSCESFLDPQWASSCIGMLVGFTVFDVTLSPLIDPRSVRYPW
jgi:hypothetical protein